MDQERAVNKALFWLKGQEEITMEDIKANLILMYGIGFDEGRRHLSARRTRKIVQFNSRGEVVGRFDSIKEAARILNFNRDVIDESLRGRCAYTRKGGYYFEYDKEDGTH